MALFKFSLKLITGGEEVIQVAGSPLVIDLREKMMSDYTAEQVLERAVQAGLKYFDRGERGNALAAFLSEVGKHPGTEHISRHETALLILMSGYGNGRRAFEEAMRGFAIKSST